MDDKHLLLGIKAGSTECYRQLYERWVSRLYGFVFRYVKSEPVTDDIVQETFLRIWMNRERLDPFSSFRSYLFTISYHLLLKELRHQLNHPLMEKFVECQYEWSVSGDYVEENIDLERFREALAKAKQKLTPRQREIFELNKEYDLSVSEIAAQLSISEQVVRNQLSASLKAIRVELQEVCLFGLFLSVFLGDIVVR